MIKKLKNLFSSVESDTTFIDYDQETINRYKEQYQHIEIIEVRLPAIENEKSFSIRKWYKRDGDQVSENERICTVETEQLTLELNSKTNGFIYFRQRPKTQLKAGQIVCIILQERVTKYTST